MNKESLKYNKTFISASKYGLRGMLIGVLWVLFSLITSIVVDKDSCLGVIIKIIDWPIMYAIAGNIFDYLVKLGLAQVHDIFFLYSVIFIVYLIIGYLFGMFYYYMIHIFAKKSRETK